MTPPAIFVLHIQHVIVDLLHAHAPSEDGRHGEVAPVTWITRRHHVLGVEHLLRELGHGHGPVRLGAARGQRREARHEKVQPREGDHVDGQFAQVRVQLARKAKAGGHAGHGRRHQVVQDAVVGSGQLQRAEANVVESLIVNAEGLVGVLHQLVHGQRGVVRLHHRI